MFCPRCGANLPEGLVYCSFCGMHTTIINKYAYRQKRRPSPTIYFITLLSIAAALTLLILFSVFTVGNPSEETSASFEATVRLTNGTERFPSRTASLRPSPLPSVSVTPVTPETPSFDSEYIEELIAYFNEIALKSEYGNLDQGIVRRWEQALRIEISGSYTDEDYTVLVDYIDMLKSLKCLPDIQIVQSAGIMQSILFN